MNPELVKFINSDRTWNAVKKGHRSMIRRPRRPGASSSEFGFCSANKMEDPLDLDYEKSGVAILSQHFTDEVLKVPIKKRILLLQSPCLSHEGAQPPQPQTHSAHCEEPDLLVDSEHASGDLCQSDKLIEKEVHAPNDFSGIELLAAAACHSSVYDSSGHVESSAVEEHTPSLVDLYADGIKEDIAPMDPDDLSVQDNTFQATQICDNGNGGRDEIPAPSKGVRLHWDLNTVMDDWEDPCCDILVDPHSEKGYSKTVYETRVSQVSEGEQGKHETAISTVALSKPQIFGIQENNVDDSLGKTYDVVEDVASLKEAVGAITCKTSDADSCLSKSDVIDQPAKCEIISTSTASVSVGQTPIKVESDRGCPSLKGGGNGKPTSEDRLSDCCDSNVSHDGRGPMADGNTIDRVKAGYDSPAEDGELREPIRYAWQTNEVEERERVDYESDNIYEDDFDIIESVKNEVTLDHHQTIGALSAVSNNGIEQGDKADASNQPNHLLDSKTSKYQIPEHSQCAILEEKTDRSGKFFLERRNVRNSLCNDKSVSFGVRRDGAFIRCSRSDNIGDSYSRGERDFGQDKFMGRDGPSYQGRARNDASGPWGDSSMGGWDSRNNHGYPRSKNATGGGSAARSYRTFNTRPSSSDQNESYGTHRETPPPRDISGDRFRGGSRFHLQGLRRAPQGEYNDPEPYFSERKVPCFSPNFKRSAHLSRSRKRSRSRSRSRSGSPIAWHFQKRKNVDNTKRQSPDCKSDTRLQEEKPPFRQSSSSNEIEAALISPTRGHGSPQCISRSFDDRNVINGQYRDRMFQRNQRFEASGYLGRLKSNDHFRPTPRPGRFPQPNREKFEANSNDSMMHDEKYRMMNGGRQFRYPVDESCKTHSTYNRDNGYRYTRENTSEDKHH